MTYEDGSSQPKSSMPRQMLMVLAPIGVIAGCVALVMAMGVLAPKPKKKEEAPNPPAVQVVLAETRQVRAAIIAQGEARPRTQATLAAQSAGRIMWAAPAYAEGGMFKRGDVILRIDEADYRLAVVRAKSQVAQAREALTREEAESDLARKDWEALGQGEASPLTLRLPQLAQAKAALAAAEASERSADLDLERTQVRAPFDGRIRERGVNVGDYAAPGAPLLTMFATDIMEIRVPFTDGDLAALSTPVGFAADARRPGPVAHMEANIGGKNQKWEGRLVRTEATIDPKTRLVYGLVEVRDPFAARLNQPLAPGVFASVKIEGAQVETLVAAPRSALKRNEFIYVVTADNTIDIRSVVATQSQGDEVFFRTGLKAGERIVVSVLPSPRQGMKVTPIDRAGPTPADGLKSAQPE
jgi:RND family efflux transporter MFP subunit